MGPIIFFMFFFLFFVSFFGLSMLSLCASQDLNSQKRKLYDSIVPKIKPLNYLVQTFNSKSILPYIIFIYGIVIASSSITKSFIAKSVKINTGILKSITIYPPVVSQTQKVFIYSFYIMQIVPYTILLFKKSSSSILFETDPLYHKLPNRQRFCKICQKNIQKFDHHCSWVGSCVGAGNHLWFSLFLGFTAYSNLGIASWNFILLKRMLTQVNLQNLWNYYGEIVIQTGMCGFIGIAITPFAFMHFRNIIKNQTTFEKLKQQLLLNELKQEKLHISTDFQPIYIIENQQLLSYEQSTQLIKNRNIWNKNAINNIKQSIHCAFK